MFPRLLVAQKLCDPPYCIYQIEWERGVVDENIYYSEKLALAAMKAGRFEKPKQNTITISTSLTAQEVWNLYNRLEHVPSFTLHHYLEWSDVMALLDTLGRELDKARIEELEKGQSCDPTPQS